MTPLLLLAATESHWIISDDYYEELLYVAERVHPLPLQSAATEQATPEEMASYSSY